jgi:hypothetical protein
MLSRLSNSWELIKASAAVLQADKELIVFPIVSAILTLLVTLTFAIPTFLAGIIDQATTRGGMPIAGYVILFLFYLAQYFVIIFSNSALIGAALIRLRGGNPTVADGFRIAFSHIGAIFGYAIISATVGVILRTIARRGGIVGQVVSSLIGMAWHLATYLVIPVMVAENLGPVEAIQRSVQYLKKTWGEQLAGNLGVGVIFGILLILAVLVGVGAVIAAATTKSVILIAIVVALVVTAMLLLALISATLSGIYEAAVYRYAAEGKIDGFFRPELIQNAFRPVRGSSFRL